MPVDVGLNTSVWITILDIDTLQDIMVGKSAVFDDRSKCSCRGVMRPVIALWLLRLTGPLSVPLMTSRAQSSYSENSVGSTSPNNRLGRKVHPGI